MDYFDGINKCINYIEEHLDSPICVQDVVNQEYYSYPHMHRVFSSIVGETMNSYIRKRRLTKAAEDLILTNMAIVDIAVRYEFASQQTFTRAFHELFRESPGQFRKKRRITIMYNRFIANDDFVKNMKTISISIEELSSFKVISCHKLINNVKKETKEKQYNKLISDVWNSLISVQMHYEYLKANGLNHTLPKKSELGKFMITNKLHTAPNTRYFGFTSPFPYEDHEYGYEAWATVQNLDDSVVSFIGNDKMNLKLFEGGLYLTVYTELDEAAKAFYHNSDHNENNINDANLDETWKYLHFWMSQHKEYSYGKHPWLEEHLTIPEKGGFHGFKLYLPIKKL